MLPDIPGIEHAITSNEALDLPELPSRLVMSAAATSRVEFAGIFHAAGAQVTEVIRGTEILRGFDDDVRSFLADAAGEARASASCASAVVVGIEQDQRRPDGASRRRPRPRADVVLYATGRTPNTAASASKRPASTLNDRGAVVVDDWSRSSVASIYAVGDCTDRMNLTPVAIAEGRAFAETHFNDNPIRWTTTTSPTAVFSQPPVGTVGLTEEQAIAARPDRRLPHALPADEAHPVRARRRRP